jgi:hypothetical protein
MCIREVAGLYLVLFNNYPVVGFEVLTAVIKAARTSETLVNFY